MPFHVNEDIFGSLRIWTCALHSSLRSWINAGNNTCAARRHLQWSLHYLRLCGRSINLNLGILAELLKYSQGFWWNNSNLAYFPWSFSGCFACSFNDIGYVSVKAANPEVTPALWDLIIFYSKWICSIWEPIRIFVISLVYLFGEVLKVFLPTHNDLECPVTLYVWFGKQKLVVDLL